MKKIISLLLALALCAGLGVPALALSDVPAGHYAASAIEACVSRGIVSGYADGSFKPDQPVTRAQFCVMLARAFFPEPLAANEAAAAGKPWYWAALKTLSEQRADNHCVLDDSGVSQIESAWDKTAAAPMTRFNMAGILYHLLMYRGFDVTVEEQDAVLAQFADCEVHDHQWMCVAWAVSKGIISGYADGCFHGKQTVNRAQACAVIDRTAQVIHYASDRPTAIQTTGQKVDSGVTSKGVSKDNWTRWEVFDNNYPTGTLNNGKPITQENVLELLAEAKTIWPFGISWGGDTSRYEPDNNYYYSGKAQSIASSCLSIRHKTSPVYGCGGFAAMISDYLFGKRNNPLRKLEDVTQVRPGDIVVFTKDGETTHVAISLTTVGTTNGGNPGIKVVDGNNGGAVCWGDNFKNYAASINSYIGGQNNAHQISTVIYTRYPD